MFDLEFDRAHGLHSLPVTVGERGSVLVAVVSHALTVVLLAVVGGLAGLDWVYWVGLVAVAGLLAWPHVTSPGAGCARSACRSCP